MFLIHPRPDEDFFVEWDGTYHRPHDWGSERYFRNKFEAHLTDHDINTAKIKGSSDPRGRFDHWTYEGTDILMYNFIDGRSRILRCLRWDLKTLLTSCEFKTVSDERQAVCYAWDERFGFVTTAIEILNGRSSKVS